MKKKNDKLIFNTLVFSRGQGALLISLNEKCGSRGGQENETTA